MNLCPLVDDVVDEARSLANQLCRYGVPFEVSPMMPARTTQETYRLITAAKPRAAMVDFYLLARPNTKSEELAYRLLHHGVHTVVVTKDRNVADRASIPCRDLVIPVFWKKRLISDQAYVAQMVQSLGGQVGAADEGDYTEKLYALQEKVMRGNISKEETIVPICGKISCVTVRTVQAMSTRWGAKIITRSTTTGLNPDSSFHI